MRTRIAVGILIIGSWILARSLGAPIWVTVLMTIWIPVVISGAGLLVAEFVRWYERRRWIRAARIEIPRAVRR